jgi:hypothetical protein
MLAHRQSINFVSVILEPFAVKQASILPALLLCGKVCFGLSPPAVTSVSKDSAKEEAEEDEQATCQPRDEPSAPRIVALLGARLDEVCWYNRCISSEPPIDASGDRRERCGGGFRRS